jgi:hypothetical protein
LHRDLRKSWIEPSAKKGNLLYVSDQGTGDVEIYSYPSGHLRGVITGFGYPVGLCSDQNGDVYVDDLNSSSVPEYAHGGTSPIKTLPDTGYNPVGCSVDPTTGNLAVTNWPTSQNQGSIAIYAGASGSPTFYSDPLISLFLFCGYDPKGNLFTDGTNSSDRFQFAELPRASATLKNISLSQSFSFPGGVQWDGKHVAIGDAGATPTVIYQFAVNRHGAVEVGATSLTGTTTVYQFWKQGSKVIAPDWSNADVGIYGYPGGGSAVRTINGLSHPNGSTISKAQ